MARPLWLWQIGGMNKPFLLLLALLPLAACGSAETETVRESTTVSTRADGTPDVRSAETVVLKTDGEKGELAIDLPNGGGASIRLPADVAGKISENTKFELDGVSLYPGAKVSQIASASTEKDGVKSSKVDVAFTAPATPDVVAAWYLAQFREKGHSATRSGNQIKGTTKDGDSFTLDLAADGAGSKGNLKIGAEKKA